MRVALAGAGEVGQSIARDLVTGGHRVLIIERNRANYQPHLVPDADWMLGDACELANLEAAAVDTCDVVVASSGDDKVNLVFSLLCKTELAVPRVVARVNNPANHWLFTSAWGADLAVSTPRSLATAVDEALSLHDIVQLITLHSGAAHIIAVNVAGGSGIARRRLADIPWPADVALLAVRHGTVLRPARPDRYLTAGDELLVLTTVAAEPRLRALLGDGWRNTTPSV